MLNALIVSDSHGSADHLIEIIAHHEREIAYVLFLGDGAKEAVEAAYLFPDIQFFGVIGNNDFAIQDSRALTLPLERSETIGKHRIYMTHGHIAHYQHVEKEVRNRALIHKATIAFHGHTHRTAVSHKSGVTVINPGSITYPRGGSIASYGMINFAEETLTPIFFDATTHETITLI